MAKKMAKARARDVEQKALERAALKESLAKAAKCREEEKELAARAAAAKAAAAAEALTVKLVREVLDTGGDGAAVTEAMVTEVIGTARILCELLHENGPPERDGADARMTEMEEQRASEATIVKLPLAARWVACYRVQAMAAQQSATSPPPVLVVYHGTRAEVVPAITQEGLRLPDGVAVRHSTALSLMHGASGARIFATLNFSRAALHATAAVVPSLGPSHGSSWHAPSPPTTARPPFSAIASPRAPLPRPTTALGERSRQSANQAVSDGGQEQEAKAGSVFLLLALPGKGSSPCDHAKSTYMFADEASLLPCFLPAGTRDAQRLADRTLQAALRVLAAPAMNVR